MLKANRGTILVICLFLVALIEGIVLLVVLQHRHVIHNINNYVSTFNAKYLVYGAESKVISELMKSRTNNLNLSVLEIPKTDMAGGYIEGRVVELQGKYNLNNLTDPEIMPIFSKVVESTFEKQSDFNYEFTNFVKDKVSHFQTTENPKDQAVQNASNDDENDDEESHDRRQARRQQEDNEDKPATSHAMTVPFTSISEALMLTYVTPEIYSTLLSLFTVLPEVTPLNVNTADVQAFLMLSPDMTVAIANQILDNRRKAKGFETLEKFFEQDVLAEIEISNKTVTVKSNYYLSSLYIKYNQAAFVLNTVFKIADDDEERPKLTVVWRSINTI